MKAIVVPLLLVAALALSGPASAMYIVTPLHLTASDNAVEVGDKVDFTLAPGENETEAKAYYGRTVRVVVSYDPYESAGEPDSPRGDGEWARETIVESLVIDDEGRATFSYTIPEKLDDKNLGILVEDAEGKIVAQADVSVGDAPPMMRALASESGPAEVGEEPSPEPAVDEPSQQNVPGAGILALAAAVGVLALALRRR